MILLLVHLKVEVKLEAHLTKKEVIQAHLTKKELKPEAHLT